NSRMMVLALLTGALSLCGFTQIAPPPAQPRWAEGATIRVWIDSRNAPAGAAVLVERAMSAWTEAANQHFRIERTASADSAVVRVQFVGGDAVYGEARPELDRASGAIVSAD